MYKVIVSVLLLVVSVSASAETCRVVKRSSPEGAIAARFGCAKDERLGAVVQCNDEWSSVYTQELLSVRSFRCQAIPAESVEHGFLCSDEDEKDLSCLPAIKVSYLCCK
jgi:hypothetical protein